MNSIRSESDLNSVSVHQTSCSTSQEQPYQTNYHHDHHFNSITSNPSSLSYPDSTDLSIHSILPPFPIQSQSQSGLIHSSPTCSTYSPPPALSFSAYPSNFQSSTLDHSSYYTLQNQPYSNPSSTYYHHHHHQPIPVSFLHFSHHQSNLSPPPPSFEFFPPHFPNTERSYQFPPSSPSAFNTPFNSPTSPPPFGSRSHHHSHHVNPSSSAFLPFLHQTAYSPTSTHSTHEPKSPTSPPINSLLVRGSLAQAKLRNHRIKLNPKASQPINTQPIHHHRSHKPRHSKSSQKPALPRPPSHSEHALWVGNVPNDASHEELWKFFSGPHSTQSTSGVESIHLISRSNCAFVNYVSQVHLQHAITICNGKTLRPFDPRSKPLVCRVRNPEDNVKSGVGAQRIGGMHRTWIRKSTHSNNIINQVSKSLQQSRSIGNEEQCKRTSSTSTFNSNNTNSTGTASTTSTFLSRHFPRRYFILKSYTEEDLNLSVETSVWASQSHNEPILDQAYRTSSEGVYLIFSANRSGEFYGYAKMTGPIWRPIHKPISVPNSPKSRPTLITTRRASANDLVLPSLPSLLIEEEKDQNLQELEGKLLPAFQERRTTASPVPISPSVPLIALVPPISLTGGPSRSLPQPIRLEETVEKKEFNESGVIVKEEEDRLEDHDEVIGSDDSVSRDGKPFEIEWIKVQKLPFHLTRDLKNPFNGHREVKVSRDGTEIEPSIGAILISRIDEASMMS